ncbi:MAG: HAD family hydrolase [Candidatus Nanoarchaeia archaeon]
MIKGLLFDLDGVIIDSEQYYDLSNSEIFSSFGKKYERDKLKALLSGRTNKEFAEYVIKYYDLPLSSEEYANRKNLMMNKFYKENITYLAGFKSFFDELIKKFKCGVAIVTGCPKDYYENVDKRINLTSKFGKNIFRAEDLGMSKPAPDIYLHAAEKIGANPKDCLVFEDAPSGIVAGYRAGAKVVALTTTLSKQILIEATTNMYPDVDFGKILIIDDFSDASLKKVIEFAEQK